MVSDCHEASAAVRFSIPFLLVVQKHAASRQRRVSALPLVIAASGSQVRKVIGKLKLDRLLRSVVKGVFQDRARDPGILVVQRNEGIPRGDRYLRRNGRIADLSFSEWKLTFEFALLKARKSFKDVCFPILRPAIPDRKSSEPEKVLRSAS